MKPLFNHQKVGIDAIVKWDDPDAGRTVGGCFFLADEMGAGKTRQAIEGAQQLFLRDLVRQVVVVTPAPVRGVWADPEFGQLAEYLTVPSTVEEFRSGTKRYWNNLEARPAGGRWLNWIVTNYEFIRRDERLQEMISRVGPMTLLILDESIAVKSPTSAQTKAVYELRKRCGRVLLLNGTPAGDNPGDLYAQAKIMSPEILGCKTWFHFRSRYAVLGGFRNKQVVKWTNLEDLNRRLKPYILRRLKADCLDLPPKLPPVTIEVALTKKTWDHYTSMRDDAIAFLEGGTATAAQATTRVLRLAQLTSGFLGGITEDGDLSDPRTVEVGREKLEGFLDWLETRLDADPGLKAIVWCRFRAELERAAVVLAARFPGLRVGRVYGGQTKEEREAGIALLNPRTATPGAAVVVGTTRTGSFGLDLQAAHEVVYLSNDYSLLVRQQSEDRAHRPGQTRPVSYFDVVALGPTGQKTVDHAILKALRKKNDVVNWTTRDWATALKETA